MINKTQTLRFLRFCNTAYYCLTHSFKQLLYKQVALNMSFKQKYNIN